MRMLVLSRLLSLNELGLAAALSASYSVLETVTDISIHRFMYSTPRADYSEALASAHALSVLRGGAVAALALLCASPLASVFSGGHDWVSFAFLAAIVFVHSLEHLEPRVSERDYRYGAQFKVSLAASGLGFLTMVATALLWRNHNAVVAGLFAHMAGGAAASHLLSRQPYRLNFRSRYFERAWAVSYPLIFNGMGLAISANGDRLMVGALLGPSALGLYSVALVAAVLPTSLLFRVMTTINLAAFHNASNWTDRFVARLRLYARATPLIGAGYALGLLALMNPLIGIAFGHRFAVDNWILVLIAMGSFFKIVRTEPFTSLLHHEMKTGTLALTNLVPLAGLAAGTTLTVTFRSLGAPFLGRLVGEILGLCVALFLTQRVFYSARNDFLLTFVPALMFVVTASLVLLATSIDLWPTLRLVVFGAFGLSIATCAGIALPTLIRKGYGQRGA
jgi:O-antigen/teichoic acid export membrane protein